MAVFFLTISSFLLINVILKFNIFTNFFNLKFHKIFIFSASIIFFIVSILSFFFKDRIKVNIFTMFSTIILSLIAFEILLVYLEHKVKNTYFGEYSKNSKYEEFLEKKKKGLDPVFAISPSNFIKKNEYFSSIFPLGGISNSHTIYCNENGYWSNYESDRYGFNNTDQNWEKDVDILLLGDSTMHGACVNKDDTISGNLKKIDPSLNILNLGYGGNGTLIEYATLKEFFLPNTKKIVFLYSEENDLKNLRRELRNKILKKYTSEDFKQNLKSHQKKIDSKLINFQNNQIEVHKKNQKNFFVEIIFLQKLRKLFTSKTSTIRKINPEDLENFKKIMTMVKNFSKKNDAELYFVYSPDFNRYTKKYKETKNLFNYDQTMKIIKDLDINIIDLHELLFSKLDDPKILFPMRSYGHYNEKGYNETAKVIFKKIFPNK